MSRFLVIGILVLSILMPVSTVLAQWVSQDSGATFHDLYAVEPIDQELVFAVGAPVDQSSGIIIRTGDSGETWTTILDFDEPIFGICSFNENDLVAVGSFDTDVIPGGSPGPVILMSGDSGTDWLQIVPPVTAGTLWDVYCTGDSTAYAVGGMSDGPSPGIDIQGTILKGIDGGESWTQLDSGVEHDLGGVYFVDEDTGYVVGSGGTILKTTDGENFENKGPILRNDIPIGFNSIFCLNEDVCWAVGSGEIIYNTVDGWDSWEEVDTGLAVASLRGIHFINETTGWVTGQNVIRHTPDGETWENQVSDIPSSATNVGLIPVAFVRDVQFVEGISLIGWAVGDVYFDLPDIPLEDGEGIILRYGPPSERPEEEPPEIRIVCPETTPPECEGGATPYEVMGVNGCIIAYACPPPSVTCPVPMDDCEAEYDAIPVYDDAGCIIDFECVQTEENCEKRLEECNDRAWEDFNECMGRATTTECWPEHASRTGQCSAERDVCLARVAETAPTGQQPLEELPSGEEEINIPGDRQLEIVIRLEEMAQKFDSNKHRITSLRQYYSARDSQKAARLSAAEEIFDRCIADIDAHKASVASDPTTGNLKRIVSELKGCVTNIISSLVGG